MIEFLVRDRLRCFIQIGSSDEYGDATSPQHEELREKAISPYALGKVANTHLLQMLNRTEAFPAVILRLFLTYGPGQTSNRFLPRIIKCCLKDEKFLTSSGKKLRDFCYVEDTVNAIIKALLIDDAIGHIINVASGKPISIKEITEKVRKNIGKGQPVFGAIPNRVGENMNLYANVEKSKDLLEWKPVVSLEEGLQRTIEWYLRYE